MRLAPNTAAILALAYLPVPALAQPIVVIPKPGDGQWVVSYTRMFEKGDAATGTELSTFCRTLAAAKQEAARLQQWSQSMYPNSSWRLKKIYIEGEDAIAGPPKDAAPKTPSLIDSTLSAAEKLSEAKKDVKDAMWALKLLTDPDEAIREKGDKEGKKFGPGSVLKEYSNNVKDAYQRAKELKDGLLKLDKKAMDKAFDKVNDGIVKYNRHVDDGVKFFGPSGNPLPKLKSVGPGTAKAVDDWKAAHKQQFNLEGRKEALDKKKADLDRERETLAAEWKALSRNGEPDATDAKVVRLRERQKDYKAEVDKYTGLLATFTAETATLKNTINGMSSRMASPNVVKEDVAAALLGTKWQSIDRDGRYTNYEFYNLAGVHRWSSEWFFKDGGKVSSNGSGGTFTAVKTASGTIVTLKWDSKATLEFEWKGRELISERGIMILKQR